MAITIDNLRIVPYTQKDTYKPIWGDTLDFSFVLPSAHADGDKYCFGCDFDRVVYPPMRPLCAYTEDYSISITDAGQIISLTLVFNTARFRDWVCKLKKPTPITLQLVRIRDNVQDTLLLDDILALPSVVDGGNIVCPGDPLEDLLAEKLDKPEEEGTPGQALVLGPDGKPIWKTGGGGVQAQADWDESDSEEPDYIRNKPTIPAPQVQADWDESDSDSPAYILNKPTIPPPWVIDNTLNPDSPNPVANSTLYNALNGKSPAPIVASTAPTTSTAGAVGQLYVDTATSKTYHCTAVTVDDADPQNPVTTYEWVDDINAKGGVTDCLKVANNAERTNYVKVGVDYNNPNDSGLLTMNGWSCVTYFEKSRTWLKNYKVIFESSNDISIKTPTLQLSNGISQNITEIPSSASAYTFADGCYAHVPSSAPTYVLPSRYYWAISGYEVYFSRSPADDGTGYYGWINGNNKRYTASATPAVGDKTYTNTVLTAGAKAITAIDRRTHEIVLEVSFANTQTYAFVDANGATITPMSTPTISSGDVVDFFCRWSPLLNKWCIMPVVMS